MNELKLQDLVLNVLTQEQFDSADKDATQLYLTPDTSIDSSEKGVAGGVATLDSNAKVPTDQIPALPYLSMSGGTLTGNVIIESTAPVLSIKTSGYQSVLSLDNSPKYDGDGSGKYNIGCLEKQLFIYRGDRGTTNSIRIDLDGNLERVKNGKAYEYLTLENKAVPNGVASLGADGKVPNEQLPETVLPDNYDYVVDSYSDGEGNWYRVYKSGWVEQGGTQNFTSDGNTVTFLKPFADEHFCLLTQNRNTGSPNYTRGMNVTHISYTGFTGLALIDGASYCNDIYSWFAAGKGAE